MVGKQSLIFGMDPELIHTDANVQKDLKEIFVKFVSL